MSRRGPGGMRASVSALQDNAFRVAYCCAQKHFWAAPDALVGTLLAVTERQHADLLSCAQPHLSFHSMIVWSVSSAFFKFSWYFCGNRSAEKKHHQHVNYSSARQHRHWL
jgi:hypothetical protein